MQKELEGAKRNKAVLARIVSEMKEMGYEQMWQQCQVKVKNVMGKYWKIRHSNRRSEGSWKEFLFYQKADAVLGTRLASEPTILLSHTSGDALVEENAGGESSGEEGKLYVRML